MADVGPTTSKRGRGTVRRSGAIGEVIVGPPNSIAWTFLTLPYLGAAVVVCFAGAWAARRHPAFAVLWMLFVSPGIAGAVAMILWNHRFVRTVEVGADTIVRSERCGPWSKTSRFTRDDAHGWRLSISPWVLDPYYPDIRAWGRGMWTVELVGAWGRPCVVAKRITLQEAAIAVRGLGDMGFPRAYTDEAALKRLVELEREMSDAAADASSLSVGRTASSAPRR
jgi:hypothetical protein